MILERKKNLVGEAPTIWASLIIACAPNLKRTYRLFCFDIMTVSQGPKAIYHVIWEAAVVAVRLEVLQGTFVRSKIALVQLGF